MRAFTRGLVAAWLVVVLPLGSVRVICVEAAADPASTSAQTDAAPDDCERLCALRHVSDTGLNGGSGSHCALSTNPSCFDIFGNIAVFHAPDAFEVSLVATPLVDHAPALYLEPSLTHLGPPPRF